MPRSPRQISGTGVYHVMVRGIDRSQLFYEDGDREEFLSRLARYREQFGIAVFAYSLMGNHVHLMVKAPLGDLSNAMKRMLLSYSHYFNGKYDRIGYLFQDRYKSKPIETDQYLLAGLRYIIRNPIEAGKGVGYWTSFRETLEGGEIVDSEFVLGLFSEERELAKRAFREFVESDGARGPRYSPFSKGRLTDKEAIRLICDSADILDCRKLPDLSIAERNDAIRRARRGGASIRQIARLTGLGRNVVEKAGRESTEPSP